MFNIDHTILILQLLPLWIRKMLNVQLIYAGMKGLRFVWDQFTALRNKTDYELKFTGQVIYLEHVLNDQLDPVNRSIYITDAADVEFLYINNNPEPETPPYVYNNSETFNGLYLENNSEQSSANQFIINIPNTGINIDVLGAIVDRYKIAGKTYEINIF